METVWLQWLGQGGYLVEQGALRIAIDPYLSDELYDIKGRDPGFGRLFPPPIPMEDFSCDWLIATHAHIDHLDATLVRIADARIGGYLCPDSCAEKLRSWGIAEHKITRFGRGDTVSLQGVSLKAVYACHTDDSIGVCMDTQDGSMYFVGDSLLDERLLTDAPRADALFCCINGRLGNMTVSEACTLAERLRPDAAVPCHYGLFSSNTADPADFVRLMRGGVRVIQMRTGERTSLRTIRGL